jgi:hypothetical protein
VSSIGQDAVEKAKVKESRLEEIRSEKKHIETKIARLRQGIQNLLE